MIYDECETKIGMLRFVFDEKNGVLQRIVLTNGHWASLCTGCTMKQSRDAGETVREQMNEYLNGQRQQFDIGFELNGTPFQRKAWQALQEIPYGKTESYSAIAKAIGCPKAVRAVGHANAVNPLPIIIPCHRVIGKNNKLTGYAGGMKMKSELLGIEGAMV
ncbi:methylated-DNA--[protein]-cysteine S-methyltransferase [Virgibacillus siamensis]|uniref:methylated-DNA--[protein]-cysteine S-methyltransferase n=1 Tax=Virgibacillus siamensis TaxID=480071 RepID=UPI001C37D838|nr:methylated-DNA--[protein]-cysteine S-methyltransferase [Virgibacillus siamensis]